MGERIIHTADLSRIEGNLRNLQNDINYVSDQVDHVNQEVLDTKSDLHALIQEFHEYVRKDQLEKNIQLAETRIVKVRQELETNFGHYGDVRRRVTGILQAVDASLVRKETIENSSEEQMLAAPRYWLAPCLIALSAWLNGNKELADKALLEGLRRDDEKTSLFFALVARRGARYKASREWLDRYFGLQDPHNLEREIVILIDGFANGIFGPDARIKSGKQIEGWIEELSQKVGFVEEQHVQWKTALESKVKELEAHVYPYLKEYSSTWPGLEESLKGAKLHKIIHEYFNDIFMKEVIPAKNIAYAVDALLDTLVSKFDDEELPLRRDERQLSLVIQEGGDRKRAEVLFDNEKTLEERVSFTTLLTNFAMHPDVSNASLATQKLSIALSKEWVKHAHDDITAENRAEVPIDIDFEIDQWKGSTRNGSNESELVQSLKSHIENRKVKAIENVKLTFKHWAALAGGILFALMGFSTPFLFLFALAGIGYFFYEKKNLVKRKEQVADEFDTLLKHCTQVLRATLAETVDWRKEYDKEDQNAQLVTDLLETITPEQYSFSSFDNARAVVN
ncbi:hypothetical protein RRV45_10795 [Bacillus sp. DTU_2020_1000418_1_SI_GHA_SEK_038]|uniref:hypothetical protein n=1 Tax=Bacillus sp. DTU_2020_1000418_1_SI_GHA_SEK_038 TaxID=3077585 RepID=UPI0028EBF424|nr:hypothetical protein [Bacillus sp. DTU_2020_1000418_1_SI_GHA_SEK_038]WNS77442.1 hypothetical protein RRV45_10795 [Bacillus sp. DTU_2020_1000418_1_SI_GHA_SEK_038]